eukprot:7109828-Prymnesium_polylepis.1
MADLAAPEEVAEEVAVEEEVVPPSNLVTQLRKRVKAASKRKKKPPQLQPITADLAKAADMAFRRVGSRSDGGETGGDARERTVRQDLKERLRQRPPDPPTPLQVEEAAVAALKEQRTKARADGAETGGDTRARALRRQ